MKTLLPLLVTAFLVGCAASPATGDTVPVFTSSSSSVTIKESLSSSSATESSSSSSSSAAMLSLLDQIRVWTPDIHWTAVTQSTFKDTLEVSTGYVPANRIQGEMISAPELGISKYREALGQNLFPFGWQTDLRQDADGVNGTRWGYVQGIGPDARYLIINEGSSDCTSDGDAPPTICKTHESRVFLINHVPQAEIRMR